MRTPADHILCGLGHSGRELEVPHILHQEKLNGVTACSTTSHDMCTWTFAGNTCYQRRIILNMLAGLLFGVAILITFAQHTGGSVAGNFSRNLMAAIACQGIPSHLMATFLCDLTASMMCLLLHQGPLWVAHRLG